MEKFFVRRPIFAIVISIVIVLLGVLSIQGLPVEQYPNITPPVVQVTATYQGADALAVDESVATPIAQSLMGVSDMSYIQSTSSNSGTMSMMILFDLGSDPDMDAIFSQNKIATASGKLPSSVVTQGVVTEKVSTNFLLVYSLYSPDGRYDNTFLSNYASINIQDELLKINGVGKVEIMGAGDYSMRIWVKPDKLNYYNVTVSDIREALNSQSGVFPAGSLGAEPTSSPVDFTYTVRMPDQIDRPEQYADIAVKTLSDGSQVLLKDVAEVELGTLTYNVTSSYNNLPGAMLVVYQTPGSNAVEVGGNVATKMQELSEKFESGIEYATIVDATTSIDAGIKEIALTLLMAMMLVIFVIYLFLQDVRATIIPLIAIPVSLIGAFMLFPLFGFTVNIISLLGLVLAIGLVVDDAIVVVEAVQVNIEKGMSAIDATLTAMKTVSAPIIATTVVLVAVFLPVSFIGGVAGKLYQQFSVTIVLSVVISSFNALTLSPALCSMILRRKEPATKGFFGWFNRWFSHRLDGYTKTTTVLGNHASRSLVFLAIIAVAIFFMFKSLPAGFLPDEDQGYVMVTVALPDASSLSRTNDVVMTLSDRIKKIDAVEDVSGAAGFDMITGIAATNKAVIFVKLKDFSERNMSSFEVADMINASSYMGVPQAQVYAFGPPSIPGLGVVSGISMLIQDRGGNDISYLSEHTFNFIDSASRMPNFANVSTQFNDGVPQRHLVINRDYALRQGVSIEQLNDIINTYLGGSYVNNFNRFGKLYQTYIQAQSSYRRSKEDLSNYYVTNSSGESVPISAFVSVKDTVGVEYVTQFNMYPSIPLTIIPAKGYSSSQGMATLEQLADDILPDDMGIAWSGVSYQEQSDTSSGGLIYLYAIVFVFLVLAALYDSWALPFNILLGVPLAIFGALCFVLAAHYFIDSSYVDNFFFQISIIMLIGLSAKNAILVVEYADKLFYEDKVSLSKAAIEAAKLRLRPIMMTAFSFIFGILPLVYASGVYSAARNIMGVALVGGMLMATILGVFIYPVLYILIGNIAQFEKRREHKLQRRNI
ncbi:MAG: efflux RND transporter permease subunit [Rikenellaceae bacterium]